MLLSLLRLSRFSSLSSLKTTNQSIKQSLLSSSSPNISITNLRYFLSRHYGRKQHSLQDKTVFSFSSFFTRSKMLIDINKINIIKRRRCTVTDTIKAKNSNSTIGETLGNTLTRRRKWIGIWLASCAGLTFSTICVGGITRLTESGLSMVDWHPFKEIPPRTLAEWESEFEKYKQFPEWKLKNRDITLEQFKFIWHMEYGHRSLGRIIGVVYFLPMAFFWFICLK